MIPVVGRKALVDPVQRSTVVEGKLAIVLVVGIERDAQQTTFVVRLLWVGVVSPEPAESTIRSETTASTEPESPRPLGRFAAS